MTAGRADEGNVSATNFTDYFTYSSYVQYLTDLQKQNPDIMLVKSIATTFEGRSVYAVKLSDDAREQDDGGRQAEADVLYTGLHHANEWMGMEAVLYHMAMLIMAYNDDRDVNHSKARWVIDNRELWFVPMLNPDGFVYTGDGNIDNKVYWRKNREPNCVPNTDQELPQGGWGVDLNRNYAWHWGDELGDDIGDGLGNGVSPYSSVYRGPNDNNDDDGDSKLGVDVGDPLIDRKDLDKVDEDPVDGVDNDGDGEVDEDPDGGFSAAETAGIKALAEENDFVFSISYHAYAECVIYPWGCASEPTPDEALFLEVGTILANLTSYSLTNGWDWYRTCGDSDDWLYGAEGIYAFSIEVNTGEDGGFDPPRELILPTCERNMGAQDYVAIRAGNPSGRYLEIQHQPLGDTSNIDGPYTVLASVNDNGTGGVSMDQLGEGRVFISYSYDGGEFQTVRMHKDVGGSQYSADIPGPGADATIRYYIRAEDASGAAVTAPFFAPYDAYTFKAQKEQVFTTGMLAILMGGLLILVAILLCLAYRITRGRWLPRRKG